MLFKGILCFIVLFASIAICDIVITMIKLVNKKRSINRRKKLALEVMKLAKELADEFIKEIKKEEGMRRFYKKGAILEGVRISKGERFYLSDIVLTNEGDIYILNNLDKRQIKTLRKSSLGDYRIIG